ncbi:MAG: hypothetical protein U1A78_29300 [Polyangia bacterium]
MAPAWLKLARCGAPAPVGVPVAVLAGALAVLLGDAPAAAYPYSGLRPGGQVLGGPTDSQLSALQFNPAAIRLTSGSQILLTGGATGYIGGYQRSTPLPAGYAPNQAAPEAAASVPIRWANPDALVAASWDLRSDSVTLAFGFLTPHMDFTHYADRGDPSQSERLSTRYHAVESITYSLWGTVAVALKLRSWLYFGGSFNFGRTYQGSVFYRDLASESAPGSTSTRTGASPDDYGCVEGACESWRDRMRLAVDVSQWGYGFTLGALAVPIEDRLWIGLSYTSPLFSSRGDVVDLDGIPTGLPWQPGGACGGDRWGAEVTRRDGTPDCGTAKLGLSFPHIVYLGLRGRLPLAAPAASASGPSASSTRPQAIELVSWLRLTGPPRPDQELVIERRVFPRGLMALPLSLRTALAVTFGVRQHWPKLTLGQELLYESPRTDPAAVSPANLDGHKLDLSLAARIVLHRRLSLLLSAGVTSVLFESSAGTRFTPESAALCRQSGYDVLSPACDEVLHGWAVPKVPGSYWLVMPHGVAGLEVNL